MQHQHSVQKNFNIPYPTEEVMEAIKSLIVNTGNTYMNYKVNETFGTVEFTIVNKVVYSFKAYITLFKVSDNETQIQSTLSPLQGSSVSESNMLSTFGDFATLLSRKLNGESLSTSDIKKVGSGCLIFALAGIGIYFIYGLLIILL